MHEHGACVLVAVARGMLYMNLGMHVACCMSYMNLRISLTWVLVYVLVAFVYMGISSSAWVYNV